MDVLREKGLISEEFYNHVRKGLEGKIFNPSLKINPDLQSPKTLDMKGSFEKNSLPKPADDKKSRINQHFAATSDPEALVAGLKRYDLADLRTEEPVIPIGTGASAPKV